MELGKQEILKRTENDQRLTILIQSYIIAKEENKQQKALQILQDAIKIRYEEGYCFAFALEDHSLINCLMGSNSDQFGITKNKKELALCRHVWDLEKELVIHTGENQ